MARRLIQFPTRNAFPPPPPPEEDPVASNIMGQPSRIAARVEAELVRKAERTATGRRIQFESIRKQPEAVKVRLLARVLAWAKVIFGR